MNRRKAISVNGTKFSAMATAALRPESVSHAPAPAGLAGAETLNSIKAAIGSTDDLGDRGRPGVLSGLPARSGLWPITRSVIGASTT